MNSEMKKVLDIAIQLAIRRRDCGMLKAVLSFGYDPKTAYVLLLEKDTEESAIEHAREEKWDLGLALVETLH